MRSFRKLRAADLLCGFGGFRLGLDIAGIDTVYSCDIAPAARRQYLANFGETPDGDLRDCVSLPAFEILCAGFPCQPFSIAGIAKLNSLGRDHGFKDETRGTIFFDLLAILRLKRPAAYLFENVENLHFHDGGRTIEVIKQSLTALGYSFHARIIECRFDVPQIRRRTFMAGFLDDFAAAQYAATFEDLTQFNLTNRESLPILADILEPQDQVSDRYILSPGTWKSLQAHKAKHAEAGHGFGYSIADVGSPARTLTARYYKDGAEILIDRGHGLRPRRLTPRECARLMGFPDSYEIVVSDAQAYKGFGNSLVPATAGRLLSAIRDAVLRISDAPEVSAQGLSPATAPNQS